MTKIIIRVLLSFALLCISIQAVANEITIDDLISQNKLRVSLSLPQQSQQIVGQAMVISIQVSTQRWFASGSQIQSFDLPNVVMQANNIITINGNERVKGETWSTQTHELTFFPTIAGHYQVPPLNINVSVNTEINGNVSIIDGTVSTEPIEFEITLPDELKDIKQFIVSPKVTLEVEGELEQDKEYAVGDAVTTTLTVSASNLPAMMIPELNLKQEKLAGLSVYHKPAQVIDRSNRGVSTGKRIESFTYIFEKPGSYVIEEQKIYWWNSQLNTLETLIIPSSRWVVASGGLIKSVRSHSFLSDLTFNRTTLVIFIVLILLITAFYIASIKRQVISSAYKKITKQPQRQLRKKLLTEISDKNFIAAEQSLFQYALFINKQGAIEHSAFALQLNALAFGNPNVPKTTSKSLISVSVSETKQFLKQLERDSQLGIDNSNFIPGQNINLNHK